MVSNTRLYGAMIAFASAVYSIWSSLAAPGMGGAGWIMLVLGVIVVVHGVVLLTGYASQTGRTSGLLMVAYAVVMLAVQLLLALGVLGGMPGGAMNTGMGEPMATGMRWSLGMVLFALLMLASGLIMTRRTGEGMTSSRM